MNKPSDLPLQAVDFNDGAYTDVTNCMMLAAIPGRVGDGAKKTLTYPKAAGGTLVVETPVSKAPTAETLKRFLAGPSGSGVYEAEGWTLKTEDPAVELMHNGKPAATNCKAA